jgi:hypothetical protein
MCLLIFIYIGGAFRTMPQSPKTCGYIQTTPTIKAELEAKCLSANNTTNNNNTIFNFPSVQSAKTIDDSAMGRKSSEHGTVSNGSNFNVSALKHHEGKNMDVTDLNVNVNVVASSNHVSTSPSMSSSTNNSSTNIQSSSKILNNNNINVISVCDSSGNVQSGGNGIIITETHHDGASYYDAIKLEENGTTAIIYETFVIENPTTQQNQEVVGFMSSNNNINSYINHNNNINKYVTNKNHITLEATSNASTNNNNNNNNGGGIIVLTGSLNELLLSQNGHVVTNTQQLCQPQSSGINGSSIKCLSDVKNPIQSIVLNLNSQSSASTTASSISSGQMGKQSSIMLSINPNQQVNFFCKNNNIKLFDYVFFLFI